MNHLKLLINLLIILYIGALHTNASEIVCYYDASSFDREGLAALSLEDLAKALPNCDYLVYGYVGIDPKTFQLQSIDSDLDITRDHFRKIIKLRDEINPKMLVLLSVGGDRDFEENLAYNKYLDLLELPIRREAFVNCTKHVLTKFGFDGLDLAWQFPKNPPRTIGFLKNVWKNFKKNVWNKIVDKKPVPLDEYASEHKQQFTALIGELKEAFEQEQFRLSLTMLPNVNSELFVDIRSVIKNISFVNLAAFDFYTPERYPTEAKFPAPLNGSQKENYEDSVSYQVGHWLRNDAPSSKINLGIASYGRSWKASEHRFLFSNNIEMDGPALGGTYTKIPGILSQSEICEKIDKSRGFKNVNVYYDEVENMYVFYEDLHNVEEKMDYVFQKDLRGVALFDLSMDDIKGKCNGDPFPLLNNIKKALLELDNI